MNGTADEDTDAMTCRNCGAAMASPADRPGVLVCPACGSVARKRIASLGPGSVTGGKYRVLKRLASGGMGDIFICAGLADPAERYVLKVLRDSADPERTERFIREAELISRMDHPCIVKVFDAWRDEHGISLIEEYIRGKDLQRLKTEGVAFDEYNVLLIAQGIAGALSYAWDELRLLHRDIKPANIMLTDAGKLKLLDFGIAKSLDSQEGKAITMEGRGLGTPGFMSPEQFRDAASAECASDIFSLGATMYFLLTGHLPYPGNSALEVFQHMLTHESAPLRAFNPSVSASCEKLVHAMLRRDPARRPSSWRGLLAAIDRVIHGEDPLFPD